MDEIRVSCCDLVGIEEIKQELKKGLYAMISSRKPKNRSFVGELAYFIITELEFILDEGGISGSISLRSCYQGFKTSEEFF